MMSSRTHGRFALAIGVAVCLSIPAQSLAISPPALAGAISGTVTDSVGVPQMGATVFLFNKFDKLAERVLTDERGFFSFAGLFPDVYSIRVTLASFVPAFRNNILVQPGASSLLNVSLATLFSSIKLAYPGPGQRYPMSDDWKWGLRTSSATRPVLRLLPEWNDGRKTARRGPGAFSDTRGVLKVAAGDGDVMSGLGAGGDLGTAFALATSFYGNTHLQLAGKVGSGSLSGIPSAAFRTSFSRDSEVGSPAVAVTMRQLYLPGRMGGAGSDTNLPALRSMTLDFDDRTELSDDLTLQYGFSLDSVSFMDRLNYFSPYARLTYSAGPSGTLVFSYTSGNARPDLAGAGAAGTELQRDLNTLAFFPRVSMRDGQAKVQRGEEYEISYSRTFGSRRVEVSAYHEVVSNAALTMDDPSGVFAGNDLLPDLVSGNAVFDAGDYQSSGYTAAITQNLGEWFNATLMYGSIGTLTADSTQLRRGDPDELRAMIHAGRRHAATIRLAATLPDAGTHLITSYQWSDQNALTPGHIYSTQSIRPEPGLNIYVRQPLPSWGLPWRMEITADLRNLLAQGYLPLNVVNGRRLLLMQTPRAFRGGLSFIF